MNQVDTYTARIYVGLKEGYDGIQHSPFEDEELLQKYCDEKGFAVEVKPTRYIYTNGNEDGIDVGIINYPRFPKMVEEIRIHAWEIAEILLLAFKQERCTIVFSDKTVMLEKADLELMEKLK